MQMKRGLIVLKNVVQVLREQARFVDEEGDDTTALEELLTALEAEPTPASEMDHRRSSPERSDLMDKDEWHPIEVRAGFGALMDALGEMDRLDCLPAEIRDQWNAWGGWKMPDPPAASVDSREPRESDRQLMRFYSVETIPALIDMMERHIARLQEKLAKHEKPFDFAPQRVREG